VVKELLSSPVVGLQRVHVIEAWVPLFCSRFCLGLGTHWLREQAGVSSPARSMLPYSEARTMANTKTRVVIGGMAAALALAGCGGAQLSAHQRELLRGAGATVPASSAPNSCGGGRALAAREQPARWSWQASVFYVACSNGSVAVVSQEPAPPTPSQMSQLSQLVQNGCIAGWQRSQGAQDATDASRVIAAEQQSGCQ
jgi:hypothetical protein